MDAVTPRSSNVWHWAVGLAVALLLGAGLRLLWVGDIEYKFDEQWTFEQTHDFGQTRTLPWFGMASSASMRNPGLSLWVFFALGRLFGDDDPTCLARGVQVLGIAALGLLTAFALVCVPRGEREAWLWAAALAAVNPLCVLVQRKIWPPSVLPVLTLLMLAGWWYRHRPAGAFVWGLLGACLGQIHLPGFFFAAGFFLWSVLFERRRPSWSGWVLGSGLGALLLVPWLHYMLTEHRDGFAGQQQWVRLVEFRFWVLWYEGPTGFGLDFPLGPEFAAFQRSPIVGGHATFLVAALEAVLAGIVFALFVRGGYWLWRHRGRLRELLVGQEGPTAFALNAAFLACGVLFTLSCLPLRRHYLIVAFPLPFIWLARMALAKTNGPLMSPRIGRRLLIALCVTQFLVAASFLHYLHVHGGAPRGDYGVCYAAQPDPSARKMP
ncbi:MAG: hypothetical protein ACJ8F7_07980 [Gemmataceae bacterium]